MVDEVERPMALVEKLVSSILDALVRSSLANNNPK